MGGSRTSPTGINDKIRSQFLLTLPCAAMLQLHTCDTRIVVIRMEPYSLALVTCCSRKGRLWLYPFMPLGN